MATADTFAVAKDALIRAELRRASVLLDRLATDLERGEELLVRQALAAVCRTIHEAAAAGEGYQRQRYRREMLQEGRR